LAKQWKNGPCTHYHERAARLRSCCNHRIQHASGSVVVAGRTQIERDTAFVVARKQANGSAELAMHYKTRLDTQRKPLQAVLAETSIVLNNLNNVELALKQHSINDAATQMAFRTARDSTLKVSQQTTAALRAAQIAFPPKSSPAPSLEIGPREPYSLAGLWGFLMPKRRLTGRRAAHRQLTPPARFASRFAWAC
jgi:uncharacterized membrane-anchored protein YhcB (DUF1043 family)